jgi:hypothetical protein
MDIALAFPLVLGGHEAGHFKTARDLGMSVQFRNNAATIAYDHDNDKKARFFGGGFEGQDLATKLMGDSDAALIASGLNKFGYALMPRGLMGEGGDVSNMERMKGRKARRVMQGALIASSIADILKASGKMSKDMDLEFFTFRNGTPGLRYRKRF